MNVARNPQRRRSAVVLGSAMSLALLTACGGGSLGGDDNGNGGGDDAGGGGAEGGETVTVGLAVPQSGVYAPLGEDMTQGFELYLEQNDNQLGGHDVELVTADTGEGPEVGVSATTRLVSQEQADVVVGIVNSATALGLRDTFVQSEVPLIIANAGADDITAEPSEYIWRASFTNGTVGEVMGAAVAEEVGDESVYLMTADYAAGHEMVGGFREAFEAAGGTVAGETFTPFGTTSDWQPYLSEVQNSGASAVFSFYAGSEAVNFVQQYDTFGLSGDVQLYGTGFLSEGDVLAAQGEAALGVITSLHYSDTVDSERNNEFVAAYQAAYDDELPTVYSVQAYDSAMAIDLALEQAETVDGPGIAGALGQIGELDSPRGPWSFGDDGDPVQPYYLREVQEVDGRLANVVIRELEH